MRFDPTQEDSFEHADCIERVRNGSSNEQLDALEEMIRVVEGDDSRIVELIRAYANKASDADIANIARSFVVDMAVVVNKKRDNYAASVRAGREVEVQL